MTAPGRIIGGYFSKYCLRRSLNDLSLVAIIGVCSQQQRKSNPHPDGRTAGAKEGTGATRNRLPSLDGRHNLLVRNGVSAVP